MEPQQPGRDSVLGTLIDNRYRIQKLLGQGGFGRTYLAGDTYRFDQLCVLKEFAPASRTEYIVQKARELFEREARVLYEIDHPQIPKFLAWFTEKGRLFLVQEYVDGKTYATLLRQRQRHSRVFSEAEVVQWLIDLLPVLDYLHRLNIVHRDISPDNVMLPEGQTRPMLIDFGLVKQTFNQLRILEAGSEVSLEQGSFVGKFGYAPPEQIRMGQCYPSSDLYALSVTALVLLTGQEPSLLMNRDSLEWCWHSYARVSDRFAQVLDRMLQDKPKHRYQSAREVFAVLHPATSSTAVSAAKTEHPRPIPTASTSKAQRSPESPTGKTKSSALPQPALCSSLSPAFLQRCQQELTHCIGPIAGFILDNILAQNPTLTPEQLVATLALEIPEPSRAKTFKDCVEAMLDPQLPDRPAQPDRAQTRQAALAYSFNPETLSPVFLERCQQVLASYIGPMASLILEDVLAQNLHLTASELVEAIAAEIPNPQQARAFQQEMG
jgi:serine/threonine protein kinase